MNSEALFRRAKEKIPGGVNSPVRAWKSVGGTPAFIHAGAGARLTDVEGKSYLDLVCSWGSLILGHARAEIVTALRLAAERGTSYGAPTEGEVLLAEAVCARVPSVEKLRLVSSGTEAAMSAGRLARAYTGRNHVVKFDGCYHGHADGMLVRAGSGVATFSLPDSPGVPDAVAALTLVARFNDADSVSELFAKFRDDIAAVIVEPVCGNMGVIPPRAGFLADLEKMTRDNGALLIFDEVITGFRVSEGGAQKLYGVEPDLTCLGKVLGGGLPLAAFGGRKEIMDLLAPEGPVYQAGTLSGNPLAVAAGLVVLELLGQSNVYETLAERGEGLQNGFTAALERHGIRGCVNRVGSMLTVFFGPERVENASDARTCDTERFARFFHGMLARGVYLPPSQFEAAFVSLALQESDIAAIIEAFDEWARAESTVPSKG
ncbi:MAG: glutamate-1-semialdehyde 2,1-aminomutase [Candidatus Binatia bacterium]